MKVDLPIQVIKGNNNITKEVVRNQDSLTCKIDNQEERRQQVIHQLQEQMPVVSEYNISRIKT